MAYLELKNVSFKYTTNDHKVIDNFNLEIETGEFVCLLGESGCGKSTVLRLITGLEKPQTGYIKINGNIVDSPKSSTGVVFQKPSLIPWLNVKENLGLGYKLRGEPISDESIIEVLSLIGIEDTATLKPKELSGGMAQRVAIGRALLEGANPLIMDEPFGALDALTRLKLQNELYQIWKSSNKTILFITHDIDEAVYLSDRIVLMESGGIADIIPIPLQRPRNRDSIEYLKIHLKVKTKLFQLIQNKQNGKNK